MLNSFDINSRLIEDDDIDFHVHHYFFIIFTTSSVKVLVKVCKTNSQIRDTLICQSRTKVKVVKMCLKGWNEPILKWKRTTWFKLYSLKVKRQDNSTFWKINSYILMINVEKAFWLIDLLSVLRMSEAFDLGRLETSLWGGWFSRNGFARTFKISNTPWLSSKSHRLSQFNPNCLSGRILPGVVLQRRKMKAFSQAMAQSGASRCLLHTLLSIPLLLNSWVSAGFISPGNSVSIGTSPTLRYLLVCGHLPTKPPIFSTHDIYTNEQVLRAVFVFVSTSLFCICFCHPN